MKHLLATMGVLSTIVTSAFCLADTATVPGTHATIQAAVDAVQGTSGALVTINSNATFPENVLVTESVEIVAGPGYAPTIRPASGIAVSLRPNSSITRTFVLRDLRIEGGGGGVNVVDLLADDSGAVNLTVDGVTISNPENDSGVTGLNLRSVSNTGTGSKTVNVIDSTFVINTADNIGARAITMLEGGSLTVTGSTVTTTGGATAFDIRGAGSVPTPHIDLNLTNTTFNVSAPIGNFSSQTLWLIDDVSSIIRGNRFNFIGSANGSTDGILISYLTSGNSHVIDRNMFVGTGLRAGTGVSLSPSADETSGAQSVTATITNNVMRNIERGISTSPQDPGDTVTLVALNNTVNGADICLSLSTSEDTIIAGRFNNNLCTNIDGAIVSGEGGGTIVYGAVRTFTDTGATFSITFANNGYYNNPNGNYSPTTPGIANVGETVTSNPMYVNPSAGDLRLSTGSPAIDAGLTEPGVTNDYDGNARPQAVAYDIGAYEGGVSRDMISVPTLGHMTLALLALLLGGVAARRIVPRGVG